MIPQQSDLEADLRPAFGRPQAGLSTLVAVGAVCALTAVVKMRKKQFMDSAIARRLGNTFRGKNRTRGFSYAPIVDFRDFNTFLKLYRLSLRCFFTPGHVPGHVLQSLHLQ